MIINPDKNNAYINFKFKEVYEFLENKLNDYVQNNLNHLNDDELNKMSENELRLVEGYPIDDFSKIFYDKIKPYIPYPINRIESDRFIKWFSLRMKKMYISINKEALGEIFDFIRQGEVFSVLTYDEIITYELMQENNELKNKIENIKNPHVNYNNYVNNDIINNNYNENNVTPNKKTKTQNKDKYIEINTGIELKEQTKGLTGLNVPSNRMISNIISKKALDE